MVRPRLVEEGIPVGSTVTSVRVSQNGLEQHSHHQQHYHGRDHDHSMDESFDDGTYSCRSSSNNNNYSSVPNTAASTTKIHPVSSLQRAAAVGGGKGYSRVDYGEGGRMGGGGRSGTGQTLIVIGQSENSITSPDLHHGREYSTTTTTIGYHSSLEKASNGNSYHPPLHYSSPRPFSASAVPPSDHQDHGLSMMIDQDDYNYHHHHHHHHPTFQDVPNTTNFSMETSHTSRNDGSHQLKLGQSHYHSSSSGVTPPLVPHRTHIVIGGTTKQPPITYSDSTNSTVQRMEGVEDHSIKPPLVVLDGANVAYAYGASYNGATVPSSSSKASMITSTNRGFPDPRGIRVACQYFARASLRVLVVLPAGWFRRKPSTTKQYPQFSFGSTPEEDAAGRKVLEELDARGLLVAAPPTDDDDAYALTIAVRENARSFYNSRHGPGYIVSNDLFRDAQGRDTTGQLTEWLQHGNPPSSSSMAPIEHSRATSYYGGGDFGGNGTVEPVWSGPGRISYTFCDMGKMDDYGDRELDFIPNPRHPLISYVEHSLRAGVY